MILLPRPRASRKMEICSALAKDLQIRAMNQWNNRVQLLYNHIPSYVGIHQAFKTSRSPVSFLGIVSVCFFFTNIGRTFLRDSWNKRRTGIDKCWHIYSSLSPQFLVPDHLNLGGGQKQHNQQPTKNNATTNHQPPNQQPTKNIIHISHSDSPFS